MVSIKTRGSFVLSIYYQCIGRNLGTNYAHERICEQRGAKAPACECPVDGETSHSHRRNGRVTRQFPTEFRRQVSNKDACRGQGVITHNAVIGRESNETSRHLPLDILRDPFLKVAIQRLEAAIEPAAVTAVVEGNHPKQIVTHSAITSS